MNEKESKGELESLKAWMCVCMCGREREGERKSEIIHIMPQCYYEKKPLQLPWVLKWHKRQKMKQVDKQIKIKGKSFKPLNDEPEQRKQVERQEDQPFWRLKSLQVGLNFEAPCSMNVFLPVLPCQRTTNCTILVCLCHYNLQSSAA